MSRYGMPSRKMLTFLNENPGSTSGEINEHLFGGRTTEQLRVRYRTKPYGFSDSDRAIFIRWQSKRYVLDYMMKSDYYRDVEIIDERNHPLSKICRGKFAYLTSPYHSRTLAANHEGSRPHPGVANRDGQRMWFYRSRGPDGRFLYFLTLKGMAALEEHGE